MIDLTRLPSDQAAGFNNSTQRTRQRQDKTKMNFLCVRCAGALHAEFLIEVQFYQHAPAQHAQNFNHFTESILFHGGLK